MACSESRTPCPGVALAAFAILSCLLLPLESESGKLYRWVDEDGNVHFTDRMPADATREKHTVMDDAGNVVEDRETLEEERRKQGQREAERKEREKAAEAQREAEKEQRRRDRVITQTFSTERDIELTRENRIEAVQVQIKVLEHGIEQLQENREAQVKRVENAGDEEAEEAARERLEDIDDRIAQRQSQKEELVAKRAEIEQRFDQYLKRFRELNRDAETAGE